jgi:hypothetical protein
MDVTAIGIIVATTVVIMGIMAVIVVMADVVLITGIAMGVIIIGSITDMAAAVTVIIILAEIAADRAAVTKKARTKTTRTTTNNMLAFVGLRGYNNIAVQLRKASNNPTFCKDNYPL